MSSNIEHPADPPADPTRLPEIPQARRQRLLERLVVLAAVLLFCLPLAWGMWQRELARWHVAAGYAAIFSGDKPAAIAAMDRALQRDPENPQWLMMRAHWTLANSDARGALEDARTLLAIARSQADSQAPHAQQLLKLALNIHAYCCALVETNLDRALAEINEALDMQHVPLDEAMLLDTRAYLRYLTGTEPADFEAGLADANAAVERYRRRRREERFLLRRHAQDLIHEEPRQYAESETDAAMAVVYYHRGQLQAELGQQEESERDKQRGIQLGYNPDAGVW